MQIVRTFPFSCRADATAKVRALEAEGTDAVLLACEDGRFVVHARDWTEDRLIIVGGALASFASLLAALLPFVGAWVVTP